MLHTRLVLILALAACSRSPSEDDPLEVSDSGVPIEDCNARVASVAPADEAYDVELDSAVVAVYSEPITPAMLHEIVVRHATTGQTIEGEVTLASNGLSATFTPDAPLWSHSTYEVTSRVCSNVVQSRFDTLSVPVDVASLQGRTWAIDMTKLQWVQPDEENMDGVVRGGFVLIHVVSTEDDPPSMNAVATFAVRESGVYVPDCPNLDAAPPTDLSDNPEITVGPIRLVAPTNEGPLAVQGVTIDTVITAEGEVLLEPHLLGFVNPADLFPDIGCSLIALQLGGSCAPCPSGQGDCLVIELQGARADAISLDLGLICSL